MFLHVGALNPINEPRGIPQNLAHDKTRAFVVLILNVYGNFPGSTTAPSINALVRYVAAIVEPGRHVGKMHTPTENETDAERNGRSSVIGSSKKTMCVLCALITLTKSAPCANDTRIVGSRSLLNALSATSNGPIARPHSRPKCTGPPTHPSSQEGAPPDIKNVFLQSESTYVLRFVWHLPHRH